jgi:acetate kinase
MVSREKGDGGAVEKRLNQQSGVLGLSGFSADIRDVLARPAPAGEEGDRVRRTLDVYLWRLRKYLGAYLALLGHVDAVIFTDTIGETVPAVRWAACAGLEAFGVRIDPERNRDAAVLPADVAAAGSPVRVLAIRTNEELAIAREAHAALGGAA